MASVDEAVAAVVCLGYPFHPPGRSSTTRVAHLETITTPTLICQGERDPFGGLAEVAGSYRLSPVVQLHWLKDGDHSFKPRKSSGRTQEQNWQEGVDVVAEFVQQL